MFSMKTSNPLLKDILLDFPQFRDKRGCLSFVENGKLQIDAQPFEIERAFWIYDVPEGAERGGHAHRTCCEILMAVHGSFDVELTTGNETITAHLDNPHVGLIIRPMVWCRLFNFSSDFVGLCLASQGYQPDGYIHSFDEFMHQ